MKINNMKHAIQGVKYAIAVIFGYTLSYMMIPFKLDELNGERMLYGKSIVDLQHCPPCECTKEAKASSETSLAMSLHTRFRPVSMYDVLGYDYFTNRKLYNTYYGEARHGLLHHEKEEIKVIAEDLLKHYAKQQTDKTKWKLEGLLNGYRRVDPLRGIEYLIDLQLSSKQHGQTSVRFEVVKPVNKTMILNQEIILETSPSKKIHFILPVASVGKRFRKFMQMFEEICLKTSAGVNVALVIVLFIHAQDKKTITTGEQVRSTVLDLQRSYPGSKLSIIEHPGMFSRGLGMDIGLRSLPAKALLYFCDVDVIFTQQFLTRCRLNAVQGQQVYYPIVFSQYNPDIVKPYTPKEKFTNMDEISKYTGHWVHYAYGMVCLYKSDYTSVGGFNVSRQGWGGEDVELFTKHAKSKLNVVRAMDPGLIHVFHSKTCDKSLTSNQHQMCIQSAAESLGSRQQLGLMLLDKFHGRLPQSAGSKG